jgi:hypothetical protein
MRKCLLARSATWLVLLVFAPIVQAYDEARAVIEKAAKAHGNPGPKAVGFQVKAKGTIDLMGMTLPFASESVIHGATQFKETVHIDIMGQQITTIQVLNGDKAWVNALGQTMELTGDQLKEMKEQAYETEITLLWPMLEKDAKYKFSQLGEVQVEGKPAIGVKVSHEGHREVDLFFDKANYLLVKTESRMLHPTTMQEVPAVGIYSEYKESDGIKEARKFVLHLDGQKFVDAEIIETKLLDKVDENEFAKP